MIDISFFHKLEGISRGNEVFKAISREVIEVYNKFYSADFSTAYRFWQSRCVDAGTWPLDINNRPIGYKSLLNREGYVGVIARIAHVITVLTAPSFVQRKQNNENKMAFNLENRILFLFSLLPETEKRKLISQITDLGT